MKHLTTILITLSLVALLLGACVPAPAPSAPPPQATSAAIANPASQNCAKQGGTLEIRDETGGQVGYCIFADGSECEEWAFFRGECVSGGNFCRHCQPRLRELRQAGRHARNSR